MRWERKELCMLVSVMDPQGRRRGKRSVSLLSGGGSAPEPSNIALEEGAPSTHSLHGAACCRFPFLVTDGTTRGPIVRLPRRRS